MQNLIVLFLAMAASGAIGFFVARERYGRRNRQQLQVLGAEIGRMRRRARTAEDLSKRIRSESSRKQKARQRP